MCESTLIVVAATSAFTFSAIDMEMVELTLGTPVSESQTEFQTDVTRL